MHATGPNRFPSNVYSICITLNIFKLEGDFQPLQAEGMLEGGMEGEVGVPGGGTSGAMVLERLFKIEQSVLDIKDRLIMVAR